MHETFDTQMTADDAEGIMAARLTPLCTAYFFVQKVPREHQVVSNMTDTHLAADDPVHIAALVPCDVDVDGDCACWHGQHLQWPD